MTDKMCCVLCLQAEETKVTGALSVKDEVTAHQNCLLFSSGIFCRDSPQFDDLFGFSVDDVLGEVKRGNKLICHRCKKKGATAGCEVKRCKKSFHYPCAVTAGAKIVEDPENGSYGLYCVRHSGAQENGNAVNGIKPQTSRSHSDATSSKIVSARQRSSSGDSTAAGPVLSPSCTPSTSKRRLSFNDKLEGQTPKRRSDGWNRIISDSSSDSAGADMAIFAPLEFDSDDSADSGPEQVTRRESTSAESGQQQEGNEDDADAESPSLLPPVSSGTKSLQRSTTQETQTPRSRKTVMKRGTGQEEEEFSPEINPHTSEQTSTSPPPSPDRSAAAPPETVCVSLHPSNPKPSIDSTRFWRGCNAAGCTQAVFAGFIREMEEMSGRIQSDEASQEDYDCALRVMEASGKLAELVTRQQEELERKHVELQKVAAAMMDVLSALKR